MEVKTFGISLDRALAEKIFSAVQSKLMISDEAKQELLGAMERTTPDREINIAIEEESASRLRIALRSGNNIEETERVSLLGALMLGLGAVDNTTTESSEDSQS